MTGRSSRPAADCTPAGRRRSTGIPASEETIGHGTHTKAAVWKAHLETFLKEIGR